MCQNCSKSNCSGCSDCTKSVELKYSSQVCYDGDTISLPAIGLTIEKGEPLNNVISILANKINELHP